MPATTSGRSVVRSPEQGSKALNAKDSVNHRRSADGRRRESGEKTGRRPDRFLWQWRACSGSQQQLVVVQLFTVSPGPGEQIQQVTDLVAAALLAGKIEDKLTLMQHQGPAAVIQRLTH